MNCTEHHNLADQMYRYGIATTHTECAQCQSDINPEDTQHTRLVDGYRFCNRCSEVVGIFTPIGPHESSAVRERKPATTAQDTVPVLTASDLAYIKRMPIKAARAALHDAIQELRNASYQAAKARIMENAGDLAYHQSDVTFLTAQIAAYRERINK